MKGEGQIQIISFYEFKDMLAVAELETIKAGIKAALIEFDVRGTIIIAAEGYNGMVCGGEINISEFIDRLGAILKTKLAYKSSFHSAAPFRKLFCR